MSILKTDAIQTVAGKPILNSTGSILQVNQLYYDTPVGQSISAQTYTDIFGMSISITPSSATNKILVYAKWFGESSGPEDMGFGLKRNGIIIGAPASPGARAAVMAMANINYGVSSDNNSTPEMAQFWYLDSPNSTALTTYTMWNSNFNSVTLWTNRTIGDVNGFNYERGNSIMILMEVTA